MGGCCTHGHMDTHDGAHGNGKNGSGVYRVAAASSRRDSGYGTTDNHTITSPLGGDHRPSSAPLTDHHARPMPLPRSVTDHDKSNGHLNGSSTHSGNGVNGSANNGNSNGGNGTDNGRSQTPPVRGSAMHKTVSDSVTSLSLLGGAQRAKAMANPAPQHRAMVAAAREAASKDTSNGSPPVRRANLRISRHAVAHVSLSGPRLPRSPSHSQSKSISMSTNLRLPSVAGGNGGPFRISSRAPHFTEEEANQLRRLHIPPHSTREGDMLRTAFSYACPPQPLSSDMIAAIASSNTLSPKGPGSPPPMSQLLQSMSIGDFLAWVTAPDPEAEQEKEEDDAAAAATPAKLAAAAEKDKEKEKGATIAAKPLPFASTAANGHDHNGNGNGTAVNPHASLVHQLYIQHLFTTADIPYAPDTRIGFVEWLKLLTIATYSREQLLLFAFRALDTNEDGMIDTDDVSFLAEALSTDHFADALPSITMDAANEESEVHRGIERKTSVHSVGGNSIMGNNHNTSSSSSNGDRAPSASAASAAAPLLSHRQPAAISSVASHDGTETTTSDPERALLAALARWPSTANGGIAIGFMDWGTLVSDNEHIMTPVLWLQRTIRNKSLSNEIWQHIRDSHATLAQPPSPSHNTASHMAPAAHNGAHSNGNAANLRSPSFTSAVAPVVQMEPHINLPGAV